MRKKAKIVFDSGDGNLQVMLSKRNQEDKSSIVNKVNLNKPNQKSPTIAIPKVENIKIKTLAEIRAERNAKFARLNQEKDEAEVSSTSKEELPTKEAMQVDERVQQVISPSASVNSLVRKIRLRRRLPVSENVMSSSTNSDISNSNNNIDVGLGTVNNNVEVNISKHSEHHVEEKVILDDVLLLEEDDDDYDITLKAEEDLLKDIDDDDDDD